MDKRFVRKKKGKGIRLGMLAVLAALVVLAAAIGFSSCAREKGSAQGDALWDGSWYEDDLGRIQKDRPLVKGMKAFEKRTGVRPFLTLLGNVPPDELDTFAQEQYEALFNGGAHLLVVYDEWEDSVYYLSARTGADSPLTEGDTARLLSCIESAYADPANDSYAAAFGAGFVRGAEALSPGTGTDGVGLLVALGVLLAALSVVLILFLRKKARNLRGWDGEDG